MTARVLDRRSRNRALLARQLLLERASTAPLRVVERLVGLQAQTPRGLCGRVEPDHRPG